MHLISDSVEYELGQSKQSETGEVSKGGSRESAAMYEQATNATQTFMRDFMMRCVGAGENAVGQGSGGAHSCVRQTRCISSSPCGSTTAYARWTWPPQIVHGCAVKSDGAGV